VTRWAPLLLCLGTTSALADEVVVWHAWRGAELEALTQVAAAFEARTGHVVTEVALPFGAFDAKLETAVPRGNGPDVFLAAHDALGKWTAMGLVEPATDDASAHLAVTVDALTLDGVRYGTPLGFKSVVLLYDPTRITEVPTTTDALIEAARAETQGDHYGLAFEAAAPYYHAPWMHAFGARALDSAGNATLDDEAQVAALAFTRRLAMDEGIMPGQPTGELVSRLYSEGKVSFVISGPWFVADQTRPIAAAPLPVVSETGRPAQPYLTVEGAFLAAQARAPEAGRAFIEALTGLEGAQVRATVGGQAVSRVDVPRETELLRVLAAQAENAVPMPSDANLASAFEAQARALRSVLRGASSPRAAANGAQTYFEIVSRPPPDPVSPTPYLVAVGAALLGLLGLLLQRLRDPALQVALRAHRHDYLWLLPAGLSLVVLVVLPFVTGATVSLFAHYRGDWTFVGLQHFADIVLARDWPVTNPLSFWFTLVVTLVWTVTNLTLHVAIGVALALLLREPWVRMRGVWRALLILPWAVPNYITALIWKSMFHTQYGAINALLGVLSGAARPVEVDWFGSFAMAFSANLITNTWLGFPFMMVITLGALQSIPRDLEEAAEVDGASWWMRFRHVVWPLLVPALVPAILLGSVWTFNMFNVVFLVSAGEPDGSTEILISEAYRWAFSRGNRYGYAAAYAVLIFGVLLAYSRVANRIAGRKIL
jgi:arabinogalactan oligomer/maltooligosaccharide transport system permease protein